MEICQCPKIKAETDLKRWAVEMQMSLMSVGRTRASGALGDERFV